MNREFKKALREAYQAPPPREKEAFLRQLQTRKAPSGITVWQFLWMQAGYIRRRTLAAFCMLFGITLLAGMYVEKNLLWVLSALMPYLAVSAVAEHVRSVHYGMAELEQATRFSLKSVLLARLLLLGISHGGMLFLLLPLVQSTSVCTLIQAGIYLLVPYLLTTGGSLFLARKIRGREGLWAGAALGAVISILPGILKYSALLLYEQGQLGWWLAALMLGAGVTGKELAKMIKGTEDLAWN